MSLSVWSFVVCFENMKGEVFLGFFGISALTIFDMMEYEINITNKKINMLKKKLSNMKLRYIIAIENIR